MTAHAPERLEDLQDVLVINPVNGHSIAYLNGQWVNSDIATQVELDAEVARATAAEALKVAKAGDTMTGALAFRQGGDTNDRLNIGTDGAVHWGPGNAGTDTNLYRNGAGVLAMDGQLQARVASGGVAFTTTFTGDVAAKLVVWGDGKHEWGSGAGARDTTLYRSAVATLKTDGSLAVGINVSLTGSGAFIARAQTSGVSSAFVTRRAADTVDRLNITADGAHEWGDGTNARDVTMTRSTTGQLRISAPTAATQTGTLTSGSAVITGMASTAGILAGMFVAGTGIPVQTVVLTVDSATQVTVSVVATANGAQVLTFGWGTSLVVRGSASQPMTTGSVLQQWNDSADVPRATMYGSGALIVGTATAGAYFEQRAQAAWVDVLRAVRAGSQVWALGDANPGAMFTPNVVTTPALILRGMASQSGDLLRLQDSTPTTLAKFDSVGTLTSFKAATTTLAYGARVIADTLNRFQVSADGKHEWGDGTAAVDVNLYRAAASILRSDSLIQTNRTSAPLSGLSTYITGESLARFVVRADGQIEIGDGTATRDVVLRRSAAAILRMDDATFEIRRSAVGIAAFAAFIAGDTTDRFAINGDGRQEWGDGTNARDAMFSRTAAGQLEARAITNTYTGTLTSGSAVVTGIASTANIMAGMFVAGTGITGGTTVLSVDSGTQITLSGNATANGAQTLTIGRASFFKVTAVVGQTTDLVNFIGTAGTLQVLAGGSIRANYNAGHGFGGGTSASTIMLISANATSNVALKVRGAAGQAQDIIRWEDSTPTTLGRIDKNGYFITAKKTAPADADLNNSELAIWLDDTIGATKAMFKAKDSAGTVRTAAVALA